MDLVELFDKESKHFPQQYDSQKTTLHNYLKKRFKDFSLNFEKFIKDIVLVIDSEGVMKKVNDLSEGILQSLDAYLSGNIHQAYTLFSQILDGCQEHFNINLKKLQFKDYDPLKYLYRIRVSEIPLTHKDELFHLPFEERHKVENLRYSINGLPCLYLGSSSYICWEELDRPCFDRIYISRFEVKKNVKLIDLSYTPNYLKTGLESLLKDKEGKERETLLSEIYMKELLNILITWPLVIACSVNCSNKGSFHEEYIIPQLLLEYVSAEQKYDGIKYFSTKIINETENLPLYQNYVFPVKTHKTKGVCKKLSYIFKNTAPLSWQAAQTVRLLSYQSKYDKSGLNIELTKGLLSRYELTDFGKIERILLELDI